MKKGIYIAVFIGIVWLLWTNAYHSDSSLVTEMAPEQVNNVTIKHREDQLTLQGNVVCSNVEMCKDTFSNSAAPIREENLAALKGVDTGDELEVVYPEPKPAGSGYNMTRGTSQISGNPIEDGIMEVLAVGDDSVPYELIAEWENNQGDVYARTVFQFRVDFDQTMF